MSKAGTTTTRRTDWWSWACRRPSSPSSTSCRTSRAPRASLGIDYPVAVDDNLATWDAYNNEYWPAEYLIDPTGVVRAYDFGEGGYGTMESNIRMLLTANGVTDLPPAPTCRTRRPPTRTSRPRATWATTGSTTRSGRPSCRTRRRCTTRRPPSPRTASPSAARGPCTARRRRPAPTPRSACSSRADDVYLVLSGAGTVGVSDNGRHVTTLTVGGIPKLYTLLSGGALQTGVLTLTVSPGVEAYDFTFGSAHLRWACRTPCGSSPRMDRTRRRRTWRSRQGTAHGSAGVRTCRQRSERR